MNPFLGITDHVKGVIISPEAAERLDDLAGAELCIRPLLNDFSTPTQEPRVILIGRDWCWVFDSTSLADLIEEACADGRQHLEDLEASEQNVLREARDKAGSEDELALWKSRRLLQRLHAALLEWRQSEAGFNYDQAIAQAEQDEQARRGGLVSVDPTRLREAQASAEMVLQAEQMLDRAPPSMEAFEVRNLGLRTKSKNPHVMCNLGMYVVLLFDKRGMSLDALRKASEVSIPRLEEFRRVARATLAQNAYGGHPLRPFADPNVVPDDDIRPYGR